MGIIGKQSIQGAVFLYIGVLLGFVNTTLLYPKILTQAEVGTINLLVSYAIVFAQFGTLGFTSAITRQFAYFRNDQNQHNGFGFIMASVIIIGSLLGFMLLWGLKGYIVQTNIDNSPSFIKYINYLYILGFSQILFLMLDTYSTVLFNAVRGVFVKEFLWRMLVFILLIALNFDLVNIDEFLFLYVATYCIPAIILLGQLIYEKQLSLRPQLNFLDTEQKRTLWRVSIYGFISTFSVILVARTDTMMLGAMEGEGIVGIYFIGFSFGTIIRIPSRTVAKISSAVLAEAWKRNDLDEITTLYKKSSINQFIVGCFLLIGIWCNIDNIFAFIPKYEPAKYVILLIGLANLFEMLSGVNSQIIQTSQYYNKLTHMVIGFFIIVVVSNWFFIQWLGMVGAALASTLSMFTFCAMRFIFLKKRFNLQPLGKQHLLIVLIATIAYLAGSAIPKNPNFIIDIAIRGTAISMVFLPLVYYSKTSEDINKFVDKQFVKWKLKK